MRYSRQEDKIINENISCLNISQKRGFLLACLERMLPSYNILPSSFTDLEFTDVQQNLKILWNNWIEDKIDRDLFLYLSNLCYVISADIDSEYPDASSVLYAISTAVEIYENLVTEEIINFDYHRILNDILNYLSCMYDNLEIDLCMIGRTSFDWDDALNHWFVVREKNNQLASINILKLPISRIEQYEILKTLLDNEDRSMIDLPK